MERSPIDIVTISREFGSGGSEVAEILGERLGWPVLDHALVHQVAVRLGLRDQLVESRDERPPGLLARLVCALIVNPPEMPVPVNRPPLHDPDVIAATARAAMLAAADEPPLVIVDHGAQCLFRSRPGTLHVRLVAPAADRARYAAKRLGISTAAAAAEARRIDDCRRRYVQRYYHCDWRDGALYDVQINTARRAVPEAAALVEALVRESRTSASATSTSTTSTSTTSASAAPPAAIAPDAIADRLAPPTADRPPSVPPDRSPSMTHDRSARAP